MKVKTVIQNNERFHIVSGSLIQCSSSRDCQFCMQEKAGVIEQWIELHNPICILCDEKPPCYICLRHKCKEWCRDKNWVEENGSHAGCCHSFNRTYCGDFECKHGFLNWKIDGWLDAFEKRSKTIEKHLLMKIRRKGKDNGKSDHDIEHAKENRDRQKGTLEPVRQPQKPTKKGA